MEEENFAFSFANEKKDHQKINMFGKFLFILE